MISFSAPKNSGKQKIKPSRTLKILNAPESRAVPFSLNIQFIGAIPKRSQNTPGKARFTYSREIRPPCTPKTEGCPYIKIGIKTGNRSYCMDYDFFESDGRSQWQAGG